MPCERHEIVVVGSGFAGSLLARILAHQGRQVLLVERGHHPRFALGESSTPLGNLALERLAARYDLPDLHALAAWGRWLKRFPHLLRGLKRGFTFYLHHAGRPYGNGPGNDARLLVAASPGDAVADTHWLRSEIDAHLAAAAVAAGVDYRDETTLDRVEVGEREVRLAGEQRGGRFHLAADLVIDASGPGGFLANHLPIPEHGGAARPATHLLYGHFEGVGDFGEAARKDGAALPRGPYPDERAAVHHLLEEGWMYVLPFDPREGRRLVSAGFVLRDGAAGPPLSAEAAETAFRSLLARYPTLDRQFAQARPVRPVAELRPLRRRLATAAGHRWLLLPHAFAFFDPMYSTGIAWSLLGVERIADRLGAPGPAPTDWSRYGALLSREADQIEGLIEGAWLAMGLRDFRLFAATSHLYFAAVSFAETLQRLQPEARDWSWEGFLGIDDPVLAPRVAEAVARLETLSGRQRPLSEEDRAAFESWVAKAIAPRNVAGLADPARANLYPADPEMLVEHAALLGLGREQIRAALPRLRGG